MQRKTLAKLKQQQGGGVEFGYLQKPDFSIVV